jgi:predicted nuclease with RNAse H fold
MPTKDWEKIQTLLKQIGLKGDLEIRALTPHEIDATTAAMTAHLYLRGKTREIGDKEEGYIVVPKRNDWRRLNERT